MVDIRTLLVLIPAFPLAAAILTAILGPRLLRSQSHWPAIVAIAASFACSAVVAWQIYERNMARRDARTLVNSTVGAEIVTEPLWTWAAVGNAYAWQPPGRWLVPAGWRDFRIDIVLRADALTATMLVMVTFIAALIAIYSAGYMRGDPGYWRFFAYVSLFVFSMTMLVSVSNFALLYVFWEAVGVCSYLLIGFWYQKPEAAAAGKKAFLVNRVGDFGFALAIFLIWTTYGTLNFHDSLSDGTTDPQQVSPERTADRRGEATENLTRRLVPGVLGETLLKTQDVIRQEARQRLLASMGHDVPETRVYVGGYTGLAICLLLLVGACGKSAQFPLHVWLPDAMEGPTPVSALIHAATMVTAGVYLLARCIPLFDVSPVAQAVVATVGGFTALLAALIALTQYDLKRVLAYSTISQLGYMFLAMGTATAVGVTAGMFHLFTHAFFKALLFLGAGSVMHAMGGVIDMRRFGGLRPIMPRTYATFLVGSLALAGLAPLSGFFSKDAILAAVWDKSQAVETSRLATLYQVLFAAAVATALLTAFYTFRAFFMTFHGQTRIPAEAGHHAHESPPSMTVPLMILAVFAAIVGVVCAASGAFDRYLSYTPSLAFFGATQEAPVPRIGEEVVHHGGHGWIVVVSILVSLAGIGAAAFLYLGDEREIRSLSRAMQLRGNPRWAALSPYQLSAHKFFFDELYVLLFVRPLELLAALAYWFDRRIVDGLVNLAGRLPPALGAVMRSLQMGLLQFYALAMVLGVLVLLAVRLWAAG